MEDLRDVEDNPGLSLQGVGSFAEVSPLIFIFLILQTNISTNTNTNVLPSRARLRQEQLHLA
jgi:hypothetical protein